jgi:membrane dipeptidase
MRRATIWDQHASLPLRPEAWSVRLLDLYSNSGVSFVSVNVGMDSTPPPDVIKILSAFRSGILGQPERYALVATASDVTLAKRAGRLGVAFDLEGTEPLNGSVEMVETYYDLGVRAMLMAYNKRNRAGGGCHDDEDTGLTDFGKAVVREMNRVGMLVDATHCSRKTTFDLFEFSTSPVIFSHSVPSGVKRHPRNIDDAQMRGCAATGGVIGINGVGLFLGSNDASTKSIVRSIDYAVQLVGFEHVGLGLDYVFDREELNMFLETEASTYPEGYGYRASGPLEFVSPSQLSEVVEALQGLGYRDDAIDGVLGGNFARVANHVWR